MTPTQLRIHAKLRQHGFAYLPQIGTRVTSYRKGYVNVNVGPRGRILCWVVFFPGGVTTSVEMPLTILN
jgi:hypothetical protein